MPDAEKQTYTYFSNVTNNTYTLNTEPTNATAAQLHCNDIGGHLVAYASLAEQVSRCYLHSRCIYYNSGACMQWPHLATA